MKKTILGLFAFVCAFSGSSCSEDDLSGTSVIKPEQTTETPLDSWLYKNYIEPYNIEFRYRYEDMESDMIYDLTPANYEKSVQMAKLVKHLCLQAYDEVTGSRDFITSYFPKMVFLVGSPAYNNNGEVVLGTAEGGTKITLYAVNNMDPTDVDLLNEWYFKTIHHEFAHRAVEMTATHGFDGVGGALVVANGGQGACPIDERDHGRCDADVGGRFACSGKALAGLQHIRLDAALCALDGEVTQVLGGAEAARHQQGVEVGCIQFSHIPDLAAADAGRLDQHVAALSLADLAGQVIDDMKLRDIGGEALNGCSLTGQRQQADDGLVDFGAVKHATTTQDHGHFFHDRLLVVENVSQGRLLYFCMVIVRPPLVKSSPCARIVSFWILPQYPP